MERFLDHPEATTTSWNAAARASQALGDAANHVEPIRGHDHFGARLEPETHHAEFPGRDPLNSWRT
jgi:hypothetical protein